MVDNKKRSEFIIKKVNLHANADKNQLKNIREKTQQKFNIGLFGNVAVKNINKIISKKIRAK